MGKKKIDPFLEAEDFEEHGSEIETQDPESGDGPLSVPGEMLQADTEAPGPTPILVVFGQRHPGDEVHIIGSFEGLIQLRDKLSEIIARRQANPEVLGGAVELTDNSEKNFLVRIRLGSDLVSADDWKHIQPEYTPRNDNEEKDSG